MKKSIFVIAKEPQLIFNAPDLCEIGEQIQSKVSNTIQ